MPYNSYGRGFPEKRGVPGMINIGMKSKEE